MTSWQTFADEQPELATAVHARFTAEKHHVLATLRSDGSPRVSGTEVDFRAGHLLLGSMPGAVKARDLQRDGRFALHANPGDGSGMTEYGDAKLSGRAVEVTDPEEIERHRAPGTPPGPFHLFRLLLEDVVVTTVENDEFLVVRLWKPGQGVRRIQRR
ncbi:pyridoxamine 5'-phosphate oxidase family protein [Marinactinospora rubrisoli]|uniref:Pyridoxamine 5'-phosphate oxidase family protein n=1 Tax=Marinactinospora rubrisoli TaxID=2715399 RepID=A0ABW2KHR4_9ACTN